MKYTRLLVGLLVILVALWVIVGEQVAGVSSDAFVNAPVVTIRSDVAGTVALSARALGSKVSKGEVLGAVTDPLVDNIRLSDLMLESDLAAAEAARLEAVIGANRAMQEALAMRQASFLAHRLEELKARLDHARNRLRILEGTAPDATAQALADAVSESVDRERAEPLLSDLALDHARERVAVLETALDAARQGVFLGDGYNDAPFSEQRSLALAGEIAAQEAALAEARARISALGARLSREKVRVNGLTGGEFRAPVDGLYWEVMQADGVTAQRGDPLVRIVDCTGVIVSLSVSENVYNSLRLGQSAEFRLAGQSRVFDATVSRLAGSGAATIYQTLAVAPSARHLQRFDVTLSVPALASDPDLSCAIGRTGRVFFDRRPLDWLRTLFG